MNSSNKSNKQKLRNLFKEKRKELDLEALSLSLVTKLRATEEYVKAKNVMIFYPKMFEVNLLMLLDDKDKNFYLPKIDGENLLCCPFDRNSEFCESCFKTLEPLSMPVEKTIIDLVIVPALAVDKNYYRLGYGGGYYDRFLRELECTKIVCISESFVINTVYPEEFDIKIDKIITA